jgi:excisionase family DNA binding protein
MAESSEAKPRLWTIGQAAKYLGITRLFLSAAIARGELQVVRIPGRTFPRLTVEGLEAWLKLHTVGPTVEPAEEPAAPETLNVAPPALAARPTKKQGDIHWRERFRKKAS